MADRKLATETVRLFFSHEGAFGAIIPERGTQFDAWVESVATVAAQNERDYTIARIDHYLSIMDLPRDRLARRALRRLRQDLETR